MGNESRSSGKSSDLYGHWGDGRDYTKDNPLCHYGGGNYSSPDRSGKISPSSSNGGGGSYDDGDDVADSYDWSDSDYIPYLSPNPIVLPTLTLESCLSAELDQFFDYTHSMSGLHRNPLLMIKTGLVLLLDQYTETGKNPSSVDYYNFARDMETIMSTFGHHIRSKKQMKGFQLLAERYRTFGKKREEREKELLDKK